MKPQLGIVRTTQEMTVFVKTFAFGTEVEDVLTELFNMMEGSPNDTGWSVHEVETYALEQKFGKRLYGWLMIGGEAVPLDRRTRFAQQQYIFQKGE